MCCVVSCRVVLGRVRWNWECKCEWMQLCWTDAHRLKQAARGDGGEGGVLKKMKKTRVGWAGAGWGRVGWGESERVRV